MRDFIRRMVERFHQNKEQTHPYWDQCKHGKCPTSVEIEIEGHERTVSMRMPGVKLVKLKPGSRIEYHGYDTHRERPPSKRKIVRWPLEVISVDVQRLKIKARVIDRKTDS